jgi:uncharacterized membrane protein YozB (DUF420 family)
MPALNATLNGLSGFFLILGFIFIKNKNKNYHRNCMIVAFSISILFLISYVTYHALSGIIYFKKGGWIHTVYIWILTSHTILATITPFLAIWTLMLALRGNFLKHKKIASITFPIWLYVSITGVLVYWMLFHL